MDNDESDNKWSYLKHVNTNIKKKLMLDHLYGSIYLNFIYAMVPDSLTRRRYESDIQQIITHSVKDPFNALEMSDRIEYETTPIYWLEKNALTQISFTTRLKKRMQHHESGLC